LKIIFANGNCTPIKGTSIRPLNYTGIKATFIPALPAI